MAAMADKIDVAEPAREAAKIASMTKRSGNRAPADGDC
jgi:hypothetical protein